MRAYSILNTNSKGTVGFGTYYTKAKAMGEANLWTTPIGTVLTIGEFELTNLGESNQVAEYDLNGHYLWEIEYV